MIDIVAGLIRTAASMDKFGGYPRSAALMREAAEEIMALRQANKELTRKWNEFGKRQRRVTALRTKEPHDGP